MATSVQTVSVTAAEGGKVDVVMKVTVDHLALVECGAELIRAGMQAFDSAPPPSAPSTAARDREIWEALEEIRAVVAANKERIATNTQKIAGLFGRLGEKSAV